MPTASLRSARGADCARPQSQLTRIGSVLDGAGCSASAFAQTRCLRLPRRRPRNRIAMTADNEVPDLHRLEEEVMEEIWRSGEISVRQAMEALNAGAPKHRAYTTYMTIMARLDSKGLLERRREGKTDFYRPVYTREEYAHRRAELAIDSVVDRFGDIALVHIARQMARLDPERRRSLLRLAGKQ
jgi:predicted transcriptional regulator